MKSIRRTLLGGLVLGTLVLLLVGAVALYLGVRRLLTEQFDSNLRMKVATFASLLEQEGLLVNLEFKEAYMPEFAAETGSEYFQIWLPNDHVLRRSGSLGEGELPKSFGAEKDPLFWDLELLAGIAGRAIGSEILIRNYEKNFAYDPGPHTVVIVMARSRESLDDALGLLLGGTSLGILILLAGGFLFGRVVIARGLRPLHDLTRRVEAIEDPVRAPGFPAAEAPEELRPVAEGLNDLLARIKTAFERERRTTANIAHELRTPVSELVILAEVALRYGEDPRETAKALEEVQEIGQQMRGLITTLLHLARIESGGVTLEAEPIDLAEMIRDCWSHLEAVAVERGQRFHGPNGSGAVVHVDRAALNIILANLLSNAVEYAPAGADIACVIENGAGRCSLVLSNETDGIAPDDLDKLTEPFWRASSSREDRAHAGIGLALAHRLAELLELDLSFDLDGRVFRARVDFPPP
ncbi:MAG: ATP-binding protein [Planctomycetota bacterium]|nr:ATP-binding protein [Planctomycetota bacterium]